VRFTVGWAAWFGNRRTGLRDRWFRLRTSALTGELPSRSRPLAGAYRSSWPEPAAAVRRGFVNRGAPQAGRWCHRALG
jgi:hypothetical protein